jgi:hypothetical protein
LQAQTETTVIQGLSGLQMMWAVDMTVLAEVSKVETLFELMEDMELAAVVGLLFEHLQ